MAAMRDTDGLCSGRDLLAAIDAAGSSVSEVSRESGIRRQTLSAIVNGHRALRASEMERLPASVLAPIVAKLAERCGLGLVELPSGDAVSSSAQALARIAKDTADVVATYADALSDGHMCAAEGRVIDEKCERGIRALRSVQLQARTAVRERVIGVAV